MSTTLRSGPRAPDAILIITVVLLLAVGLTWLVPAGAFDRQQVGTRTVVVAGTYHAVEPAPVPWWGFFTAPLKGMTDPDAAMIMAFALLIGGAFAVLNATGAIDAMLFRVLRMARDRPALRRFVIPLLMLVFSIGGNTFGMSEEVLVFLMITIPLAKSMGWDTLVGVAIPFIGAGVGFAGAAFNPFTVGIAQSLSELPLFSGWEFRMAMWAVLTAIATAFVMRYAARVERDPRNSVLHGLPRNGIEHGELVEQALTGRRIAVLLLFAFTLILLVVGVNSYDWYIEEIAGLFIAMGIAAAVIGGVGANTAARAFAGGAKDMVVAALLIGLSRSVLIVMQEGRIVDTVLFGLSSSISGLPSGVSAQLMFLVQFAINFFVPSGSGQAALTMPIMTPLADLLHIPRQAAVIAFQLGDGLSNFIMPTSGVLGCWHRRRSLRRVAPLDREADGAADRGRDGLPGPGGQHGALVVRRVLGTMRRARCFPPRP
ncbi:MAG: YfcC family protein [Flavobacteriales bacterium]|nr:YfcC family protein [Flavobacteriales bacterium]